MGRPPCPLPSLSGRKAVPPLEKAGLPALGVEDPGVQEGEAHLSKSLAQRGAWVGWGRPATLALEQHSELCFLDENPRQLCEPTQCLFGS